MVHCVADRSAVELAPWVVEVPLGQQVRARISRTENLAPRQGSTSHGPLIRGTAMRHTRKQGLPLRGLHGLSVTHRGGCDDT
jgi:hypothetical protein